MQASVSHLRQGIKEYLKNHVGRPITYVEGPVHSGKTTIVLKTLAKLNVEVIRFKGGQIRGKDIVRRISPAVLSKHSVLSLFGSKPKELLVWIDDVTAMLNSDKAGLSMLIQFLKKLKTPSYYIVASGRTSEDKRIADLRSISRHYVMKPHRSSIKHLQSWRYVHSKAIAKSLLEGKDKVNAEPIADVGVTALSWHENLGTALDKRCPDAKLETYLLCLKNLAACDHVTKTSLTNKLPLSSGLLLKSACRLPNTIVLQQTGDFKFTKAITKFSTYHNNSVFLSRLCCLLKVRYDQIMDCDLKYVEGVLNKKDYMRLLKLRSGGRDRLSRLP